MQVQVLVLVLVLLLLLCQGRAAATVNTAVLLPRLTDLQLSQSNGLQLQPPWPLLQLYADRDVLLLPQRALGSWATLSAEASKGYTLSGGGAAAACARPPPHACSLCRAVEPLVRPRESIGPKASLPRRCGRDLPEPSLAEFYAATCEETLRVRNALPVKLFLRRCPAHRSTGQRRSRWRRSAGRCTRAPLHSRLRTPARTKQHLGLVCWGCPGGARFLIVSG